MRFYVIVIDVAAPGRSVHHLGITPGGVICGHRDNSAIGRSLRARALACTHVDPHRGRARPGIIAPGVIAWPPGFASTTGRPAMEPGSFSRTQGSANAGQRRLCTPVPAAATPLPSSVPRHDRAVRREVGRDQNCAGSPPVPSQHGQATCAPVIVAHCPGRPVVTKPEGATTASTSGSPASQASEQGNAPNPGLGGRGHSDQLAPGRTCPLGSRPGQAVPPGGRDAALPRGQAPRGSPCRG